MKELLIFAIICGFCCDLSFGQTERIKVVKNYGNDFFYFDNMKPAVESLVPTPGASEVFSFYFQQSGTYTGGDNTNVRFEAFNNGTQFFVYALPNITVEINCAGNNGWIFKNAANVHIGGDFGGGELGYGKITLKNCINAFSVYNVSSFGISQIELSANGPFNGSAIYSLNSGVVIGDMCSVINNVGVAVVFQNTGAKQRSLYISGVVYSQGTTPVVFSGNSANVYSQGLSSNPSLTNVNLFSTNINTVDCCIYSTVSRTNTSIPVTCSCSLAVTTSIAPITSGAQEAAATTGRTVTSGSRVTTGSASNTGNDDVTTAINSNTDSDTTVNIPLTTSRFISGNETEASSSLSSSTFTFIQLISITISYLIMF